MKDDARIGWIILDVLEVNVVCTFCCVSEPIVQCIHCKEKEINAMLYKAQNWHCMGLGCEVVASGLRPARDGDDV